MKSSVEKELSDAFDLRINFDLSPYTKERVINRRAYFKLIKEHPEIKESLTEAIVEAHDRWMKKLASTPVVWG